MTPGTLILIFISVSFSVSAQLLLKQGMASPSVQTALGEAMPGIMFAILTNLFVLSGLFAYVASAGIWLFVLSKVEVSRAYPFVGLGFIGTMLFAYVFLNEPLTPAKIAGTLLVAAGVFLISQ